MESCFCYSYKMIKAMLFDADGVLTLPEEMFSVVYTKARGLDPVPFERFFKMEWQDFILGKRDLKEHIRKNPDLWQWDGTPEELLDYWCTSEDVRNNEMIELIKQIRQTGMPCYLATEQEKYRGNFMKDVMFKDLFNGFFITAELGIKKSDPKFFEKIIELLNEDGRGIKPEEILFLDDSQSKVDAAKSAGINAQLFTGIHKFKEVVKI